MDSQVFEDEDIKAAFLEYLDEDEQQNQITTLQCLQKLSDLVNLYKDEKNILEFLKRRMLVMINSTPNIKVSEQYQQELQTHFLLSDHLYKITRIYSPDVTPSVRMFMKSLTESQDQPPWPTIQNHTSNDEVLDILTNIFNYNIGRVANHEHLLLWFPDLLKNYWDLLSALMHGQGFLPQDWRYYIAITAVSYYGCEQLYELLVQQFNAAEGDIRWIEVGQEAIPDQLKQLFELCKILAFKAWDQTNDTIILQKLLFKQSEWMKKDLLHAVSIFIFFNSLACYSMANGITNELDLNNARISQQNSFRSMGTPRKLSENNLTDNVLNVLKELQEEQQQKVTEEEEKQQQPQQTQLPPTSQQSLQEDDPNLITETNEIDYPLFQKMFSEKFSKYTGPIEYPDENNLVAKGPILRSSDFTFQINGYPLLKEVLPEIATKFLDFIQQVKKMTKANFGAQTNIYTEPFRKAVRIYVENIHRYQHDDVNYQKQQNQLLPIQLKHFIKLLIQNPAKISPAIFSAIPLSLGPDEKCHITLLSIAAKMEMQLVYLTLHLGKFL